MYPKPVPAQGTQSCGKPSRFQRDMYKQKTPTFRKMEDACYKITPPKSIPGKSSIHSRRKQNFVRAPRATHCTDHAKTSTTAVSGRPSSVDPLLGVCANGARTKRCEQKNTKNSQKKENPIGWVGVVWQRRRKKRQSLCELDNQGTVFCVCFGDHLGWRSRYIILCGVEHLNSALGKWSYHVVHIYGKAPTRQ